MKRSTGFALYVAMAAASLSISANVALAEDDPLKIFFVGPEPPMGFHAYLDRGASEAAKQLGIEYTYVFPDQQTLPAQVEKISAAIAAGADGIVINGIGADEAYYDVIAEGKARGVVFGSALGPQAGKGGELRPSDDPFLFHVGMDEYQAGYALGQELAKRGLKTPAVIGNPFPFSSGTCVPRAQGVADALAAAGIESEIQEVNPDPGQVADALTTYLRVHPTTGAALVVCGTVAPVLEAKQASGRDDLVVAGFDIDPTAAEAIKDGRMAFTIDQQQYWRGYMPVILLAHYLKFGLVKPTAFLTGPAVIDAANIDEVQELVAAGYR